MRFQCPYCGVGCGLLFQEGKVRGDREHKASKGDLCQKPLYYPKVMQKDRLLKPLFRESKNDPFKEISWEEAYRIIASKLQSLSPEEVFFYLSGQLMTEEIYLINKFVKGFLRTNNIDANSRLCMATPATAYRLTFGSDGPPCSYEDIEDTDTFVFAGSNALWTHPVLFKRVLRVRQENPQSKIVVIDPVKTETAKKADIHLQLRAGTDTVLFNSVLCLLYRKGWIDEWFVKRYVEGFEEAMENALKYPPDLASRICEIEEKSIHMLAELYAFSKKLISFWCQGLNQSPNALMNNLSLINLHLATGRLNSRGCPFSLTGQPNAMGGREMGYLSSGLPGYRDVRKEEDRSFMEEFWGIPHGSIRAEPGPTITEAVHLISEGKIRFLWVVCTNPAVTLPDLRRVWRALEEVFLVVQDAYWTDTCSFANLVLPAAQMGEKDGVMTGSDRTVSYCEKFSEPPGEAKPDWLIFKELAELLGYRDFFSYKSSEEIFKELKGATEGRLCHISHMERRNLPQRWGGRWLYADLVFPTENRRARMHPTPYTQREADLILLTGRTKNQWHTMTRTGKSPELLRGEEEPFLLMSREDGERFGIGENHYVRLISPVGEIVLKVRFGEIKSGNLFAPFGYGLRYGAVINTLTENRTDPLSKQPELKFTPVKVEAVG